MARRSEQHAAPPAGRRSFGDDTRIGKSNFAGSVQSNIWPTSHPAEKSGKGINDVRMRPARSAEVLLTVAASRGAG